MFPAKSTISESEFPGYIQIAIIKKDPQSPLSKRDNEVTDLVLKEIDLSKLPYYEHYSNMEGKYQTSGKRLATVNLLLRSDHVPPQTILAEGGFQPKYTKLSPNENVEPGRILNPRSHAVTSTRSGSVSCTWSLSMIKEYSSGDPNYVYLVKATGGFKGTNIREPECEITVPGGIDAEDIIAFRQLAEKNEPNAFDPNKLLFININFVRRYPHLITYILDRFLEPDEICLDIDHILNNLPGVSDHSLPENATLETIKERIGDYFNEYISQSPMHHKERAIAVNYAIQQAKTEEDIWYILDNQYSLFMKTTQKPIHPLGSTTIPGLKSYYTNLKNVNLDENEDYLILVERALSAMPRVATRPELTNYLPQQVSDDELKPVQTQVKQDTSTYNFIDSDIENDEYVIGGGEFINSDIEEGEYIIGGGEFIDSDIEEDEYIREEVAPPIPSKEELLIEDETTPCELSSSSSKENIEGSKKDLFMTKIEAFKEECANLIQNLNQYETPGAKNKAAIISKATQLLEVNSAQELKEFYEYISQNRKNLTEPDDCLPKNLMGKMISFTGYISDIFPGVQSQKRFFNENRSATKDNTVESVLDEMKKFNI